MKYYFCLPVAKEYPKNKNESRLANLSNPSREKFLRSPRFLSLSLSLSLSSYPGQGSSQRTEKNPAAASDRDG